MTSDEWQIKDVCWLGEPVCLASANASASIFAVAGSLKWRLKDSSVWPHVFLHEPAATAAVAGVVPFAAADANCVNGETDTSVAACTASATASHHKSDLTSNRPPSSLDDAPSLQLPLLPRAGKAPVLHRKGAGRCKTLSQFLSRPQPSAGAEQKQSGGWDFVYRVTASESRPAGVLRLSCTPSSASHVTRPIADKEASVPSKNRRPRY
jgi:hypothetical protein